MELLGADAGKASKSLNMQSQAPLCLLVVVPKLAACRSITQELTTGVNQAETPCSVSLACLLSVSLPGTEVVKHSFMTRL